VAGLRDGLMAAAPDHQVQEMFRIPGGWCEDECPQEPDEFGAGQRDEIGRFAGVVAGRGSGCQGEDGGRDQTEQRGPRKVTRTSSSTGR